MHTLHSIHMPHHVHPHATMYARVYSCTHCGRKGHLAKFYYDILSALVFANENVWVRRGTNPHGAKKV